VLCKKLKKDTKTPGTQSKTFWCANVKIERKKKKVLLRGRVGVGKSGSRQSRLLKKNRETERFISLDDMQGVEVLHKSGGQQKRSQKKKKRGGGWCVGNHKQPKLVVGDIMEKG